MRKAVVKPVAIFEVPVSPELEAEIRAVMGKLEADHLDLPHQILILMRSGLQLQQQLAELYEQAYPRTLPKRKCRILPFPRGEN